MEQSLNNIYEASDEDLHAVVWGEEKLDYAHEDAGLYPLIEGKESE